MSGRDPGRLHVLTDVRLQRRFDHVALVRLALEGGADVVQIRHKAPQTTPEERVRIARQAMRHAASGRVLINDHIEVARRSGAAGVHLGRNDPGAAHARLVLGEQAWIGVTANDLDEALRRSREPVDYLGVGPVFATGSKAAPAPVLGLDGLARIAAAVQVPVIAIGGIDRHNLADVMATGVHGVAVLSAVVCTDEPAMETALLRQRLMDAVARVT